MFLYVSIHVIIGQVSTLKYTIIQYDITDLGKRTMKS